MNTTRTTIWIIGVVLVVVALFMLFFSSGLSAYVPAGIAFAGLLLIIGVVVMSFAERTPGSHDTIVHGPMHGRHEPPTREEHIIERGGHGGHH